MSYIKRAESLKLRLRLFWLKMILGNHFTPAYVFGKHRKLGQTEINFCVDCKITLFPCKTILGFILPLNHLYFSHTLSKLLTHSLEASHTHSSQTLSKLSCDRAPQSKTRQK